MINCPNCISPSIISNGIRKSTLSSSRRYICKSCDLNFSVKIDEPVEPTKSAAKKFVITSCQNNAAVNIPFLQTLNYYCQKNNAELLIVPIIYRVDDHVMVEFNIPEYIDHTMVRTKLRLHDEVYVMGQINFIPTTVNPLSGLESLSRGDTLIVPSPQLRMKSTAVSATRHPAILHTTGAISYPEYANNKVGEKAKFNHSYSAVLVEVDSDNDFHIRVLNADHQGNIKDIGVKYLYTGHVTPETPVALVTGDEHAMFANPDVELATYTGPASIIKTLQPKYVVRHDVLDFYSGSHHHMNDYIKTVTKYMNGTNCIETELKVTLDYLERTSKSGYFQNILVASNHTDHFEKWLTTVNIKTEPWNAVIYHKTLYIMFNNIKNNLKKEGPFEIYCKENSTEKIKFLDQDESFMIANIELGQHGHIGKSGSRGSLMQFSNMCDDYVIGHSHTPGIVSGAYQVGTSSIMELEYAKGPSSWLHTHCLIYKDGTRQLINIINGKWRA